MSSLSVWFGTVDTATSTAIIITDYSTKIGIYIGSGITYQNNAVTGGTLNAYGGYTYRYPDYLSDPVYTVTGLSLSAATVYSYVQSNRATQLSILALAGNDAFLGSIGADYLIAYEGNDTLDGGSGNDTLVGGAGDDIYYVDSQSDVVVELSRDNTSTQETFSIGNNNDAIVASVSYVLSASTTGIEDMLAAGLLTGSTINNAINLTGNSLAQGLIGNDANNTLNGKGGDDQLIGAGGNDTLIGEDGNDFFMSGAGDDSMSGGKGNDFFSFNLGESEGTNLVGVRGVMALTGGKD
jgi:Ca2+-binding RTX toxin-like protein